MSIFRRIIEGIQDACYIWREELKQVLRDEGVLIFCVIVPLVYPLLYSWIYNNEVVHEVPVVIVDESHSHLSRQFARMCKSGFCHHLSQGEYGENKFDGHYSRKPNRARIRHFWLCKARLSSWPILVKLYTIDRP